MTRLQKVQMRQSELKQKLNDMLDTEIEKRSETYTDDMAKITNELRAVETELQAAIFADDSTTETRDDDGEGRELREILALSSVGEYLDGIANDRPVEGAGRELRQALEMTDNQFPVDLLLDGDMEQRADANTSVTAAAAPAESQSSIAGRVFAASSGAYMGVNRPTVPVGTAAYVSLSTGTSAELRSDGVVIDSTAATFAVKEVNPVRVTSRYTYGVESTARLSGLEEALRSDLRADLGDKLDNLALNGKAAVSNTSPAVEGLISTLADPTNPSSESTWKDYYTLFASRVDGKYSADGSNVRVLVNPETYRHAAGLQIATSGDLLIDRLPAGRFRASANMPDTASTISTGLTYAASSRRGYVQPVWRVVTAIRDQYTGAATGTIALTIIMLSGFAMIDSGAYSRVEFKVG